MKLKTLLSHNEMLKQMYFKDKASVNNIYRHRVLEIVEIMIILQYNCIGGTGVLIRALHCKGGTLIP
jgi:hypothetical protein